MVSSNTGTVMTISNSIIGVSVLAMPFCFKECGIVLSVVMLVLSSILSRLTCYLLLKAAVLARRRTFEFLAFHIFGPTGKFLAELCIIGFLMGTCIAFFVVVGDLGPAIISKMLDIDNFSVALRPSVLIGLALVVVLPLGLLRNVDSLSSICTATIGFYVCLVVKVALEALPHLMSGVWLEKVNLWRPAGVMQCLPIFSMALFCQTQLFEIYDSLPNASLERMNSAVRSAINLCAGVYISVGFFGYVAFCTQPFGGNILMSFSNTILSEVIKLGFVMSLAVSFPLVIFPCRASLYSLLFRRIQFPPYNEAGSTYIPEARFKCITVFIIASSLLIGLLIPNIELVLGLVGSTIGVAICVMFPALAFLFVSGKDTAERLIAQLLLFVGVLILVLGTYATINAAGHSVDIPLPPVQPPEVPPILEQVLRKEPPAFVNVVKEPPALANEVTRKEPPVPVDPGADKPKPDIVVLQETNISKEKVKVIMEAVIDKDALKKEDEELAQANVDNEQVKKETDLLKTLEKHKEEQNKLLEEQREIIQKLKEEKVESKKEEEKKEERKKEKEEEKIEERKKEKEEEMLEERKKEMDEEKKEESKREKKEEQKREEEKTVEVLVKTQDVIVPRNEQLKVESKKEEKTEMKQENDVVKLPLVALENAVNVKPIVAENNNAVVLIPAQAQEQVRPSSQQPIAYQQRYQQAAIKQADSEDGKSAHRDILETRDREKRDAAADCPLPLDPLALDPLLASGRMQADITNEVKPMQRDLKSVVKSDSLIVNETEIIK